MNLEQLIRKIQDFHVLALPGGLLLAVVVFVLALWMGAALAAAEKLTFLRALALGPVQLGFLLVLGYFTFFGVAGADMNQWLNEKNLLLAGAATLAIDFALTLAMVLPLGFATPGQSIWIAVLRLPILGLLSALVGGLVFVGLAIYQAAREPDGEETLIWVGCILAVVVTIAVSVFLVTRFAQAPVARRTGA
jgi:hypothetical protein